MTRAVQDAKRGDTAARKWLADYLIGTPEQKLDVTSNGNTVFVEYVNDWRETQ